jgi:hypothetical protein
VSTGSAALNTTGLHLQNKNKTKHYFTSFKQFVTKHRNLNINASPQKKWTAIIPSTTQLQIVKITNKHVTYEHCHNIHMCTLRTKKHIRDEIKESLINYPTYFRVG